MSQKYVFADFEFRSVSESALDLVCCSLTFDGIIEEYWLFCGVNDNTENIEKLRARLTQLQADGYVAVGYSVEAEASSLISMEFDPLLFKWLDLFLEYRMLQNHCHRLMYGKQYIDGVVKLCPIFGEKGKQNLAAALYKLCGHEIDTKHKTAMRNIIIHGTPEEVEANRHDIQKYCTSDIIYLPELLDAIKKEYLKLVPRRDAYGKFDGDMLGMIKQEAYWRGEYAVRTAMMVRHGYPINLEWARNLTDNIPHIMKDMIQEINSYFPDIQPFRWNKPKYNRAGELVENGRYSQNQKAIREWIGKQPFARDWELTDGGKKGKKEFSLKQEEWEKHYNFRHSFPSDNFGAQMVRYGKTAQSLKGFKDKGGAQNKTFWDHVGSDGMVRPYMNPYGAQSSRTQPGSIGFLFLKSAWQRAMCQAPEGYAIGAIDFSSQEFLLGGIQSGDKKMLAAYASGDVYLAYGKEIGVIPKDGTKKTHEKERDAQKPVILGWQYWITGHGLSKQLINQTGRMWEPEEAQDLLDTLDATYSTFAEFRQRMIDLYESHRYLKLIDGWYMWGNNQSERSTANCHVQGMGAAIMRKAVQLAQDAGLKVIFTLHDALYIMFKVTDTESMETLKNCMREAFMYYFKGEEKEQAGMIRMDAKAWSNEFQDGEFRTKSNFVVKTSRFHIDSRSVSEYKLFSKYFLTASGQDLL